MLFLDLDKVIVQDVLSSLCRNPFVKLVDLGSLIVMRVLFWIHEGIDFELGDFSEERFEC